MRKMLMPLGILAGCALALLFTVVAGTPRAIDAASTASVAHTIRQAAIGPAMRQPRNTPQHTVGAPAISPHANVADVTAPAFTTADVTQYLQAHNVFHNLAKNSPLTVTRVSFMTSQQVMALLHLQSTDLPDGHPLCYVEIQGTFTFAGPPGVTLTYQRAMEVFDARTGNLLLGGGLQ